MRKELSRLGTEVVLIAALREMNAGYGLPSKTNECMKKC